MNLDLKFLPLNEKCFLATAMKLIKTETSHTGCAVCRNLFKFIDRDVAFGCECKIYLQ